MSFAFGIGIGSRNQKQEWLEVYYQHPSTSRTLNSPGWFARTWMDWKATQPLKRMPTNSRPWRTRSKRLVTKTRPGLPTRAVKVPCRLW